jgi:serine/threonine protein kinase
MMFAKQNDLRSLKLIDFGLSAKYNHKESISLTDKCGTAIYMAPEVFSNYQYSKVSAV